MLCENCGNNEANVKYTQVINGVKKQMNLCEECAKKLGINDISFNMPINFSNFLDDVFDEDDMFMPSLLKPQSLLCDNCKMSYEDFVKEGKFGCANCYDTFENRIDSLLTNIHGVNRHVGRGMKNIEKPKQESKSNIESKTQKESKENKEKEDKIIKLKERLKQEIEEERYEDAAKTRDEIKKLGK